MTKSKLLSRVKSPNHMYTYCRVMGCPNPASAGTDQGLNQRYCRKHEDHYERHGSYTKASYSAAQIDPHRKAALRWLNKNSTHPTVVNAIKSIESLYRTAGHHIEAFRLRGLSPQVRARAAWARLREASVDPRNPLAAWLAVEMMVLDDPQPESKQEYKWVQAAKLVHRMASGTHKRWERVGYDGKIRVEELHKYPRSRGRVLIHMGKQLEKAAELIVGQNLAQILSDDTSRESDR